jgi:flagellar hook assembly protein FlgD
LGNYPNPFNPETKIHYNIEIETKPVYLEIYNCKGRLIKKIHLDSSQNHVLWDGTNQTGEIVGSGIYFYKISQKKNIRKMVLLK